MELGNELRAGLATLGRFHDLHYWCLPSLYHIKLITVDLVTHLGETHTNPNDILFCMDGTIYVLLYSFIH